MGRTYDARGRDGRLFPKRNRVLVGCGGGFESEHGVVDIRFGEIDKVARIEFDDDADEGPATVTILVKTTDGRMVRESDFRALARVSFRCICRLEHGVLEQADSCVVAGVA